MKKTWIWCLVGLFLVGNAAWSQDGTEKAVAALEQKWLQSQKTNNPDMVAPLLSDKFVNTGSDGKVTSKTESLASAKATKYDSVDYEDVKVTAFGDTAVATGDFKAKGTDSAGKPLDLHERFTDTWVKGPKGAMAMCGEPSVASKNVICAVLLPIIGLCAAADQFLALEDR